MGSEVELFRIFKEGCLLNLQECALLQKWMRMMCPYMLTPRKLQTSWSKEKLENDLRETQASTYSKGTMKNLLCQWRSFIRFCVKYGFYMWPVPMHVICLYAQFLAYTFRSAKAVRNYMSGVKLLHLLAQTTLRILKTWSLQ